MQEILCVGSIVTRCKPPHGPSQSVWGLPCTVPPWAEGIPKRGAVQQRACSVKRLARCRSVPLFLVSQVLLGTNLGCLLSLPYSHSHGLIVSPDGTRAAYTRRDMVVLSYGGKGRTLGGSTHVRWCSVASPWLLKSVEVDSFTGEPPTDPIGGMVATVKFSPDSRHLAVLVGRSLSCIDLRTSRMWPLAPREEMVTSFAWSGDAEVVYIANPSNRSFFRHAVHDPSVTRSIVCEGAGPSVPVTFVPVDHWSPDAEFVLFADAGPGVRLLNMQTGALHRFGESISKTLETAWKTDGSGVLSLSYATDQSIQHALLMDLRVPDDALDVTSRFVEGFSDCGQIEIEPLWTADNKYVIVNTSCRGGFLVRPHPWECVAIGDRVFPFLGGHPDQHRQGSTHDHRPPTVHRFPYAGWVMVLACGKYYAVDYTSYRALQLTLWPTDRLERSTVVSPNGKYLLQLGHLPSRIKVKKINLSAAKPLVQK